MEPQKRLLAFVTDENEQLFIHVDREGLDILINTLGHLKRSLDKNEQLGHEHLMSEAWGGWELSLSKMTDGQTDGKAIHHVKLYGWQDDLADENGFDRDILS